MTSQPPMQTPAASSKPSVTLPSSAHLDPGAYVRGTHPISLGNHTLVHPRAHLLSTHAPLMVGDGCIVAEKAVVGGPLPATSTDGAADAGTGDTSTGSEGEIAKPAIVEDRVHIHPHAQVYHSTTLLEGCIVESHATILPGVVVGKHSKICGGVTIRQGVVVPDWTVVWSDGEQRRRRRGEGDQVEEGRLKAMEKEREATILILRNAAVKASAARREKGR